MAIISTGMGEWKRVAAPDRLQTILGSCIGLVLHDPGLKIAALAHIMLPVADRPDPLQPGKFATTAVPVLVQALLQAGASRARLRAKLAGGAAMFRIKPMSGTLLDVGARNIVQMRIVLQNEGIAVLAEHCGGTGGRKMQFDPATGQMLVEVMGVEKLIL